MDDYQLEQFERINEDMRNEGIPDDVLEQSRLLNSLSLARDLAQWRYELANSLPEGKTWDAVLDFGGYSQDMKTFGIQGLRFLDDKVYVKMYDGKVVEPSGMSLSELVKIKTAVDVERHFHEVTMQNQAYKDSRDEVVAGTGFRCARDAVFQGNSLYELCKLYEYLRAFQGW